MKNVVRVLLLIPMSIGFAVGIVISPFVTGFLAGLHTGDTLIEALDE